MAEPNPNTSATNRTGDVDTQSPENQNTPHTVVKQPTSRLEPDVEIRDVDSGDDSDGGSEEDPDQWLLRQNATSAAIYQRKLLQQAKKKGKILTYETLAKKGYKKKDPATHDDGRSGELGGDARVRGCGKSRDEPDGYESSSSDSDYNGKKHRHRYRHNDEDDDLVRLFR